MRRPCDSLKTNPKLVPKDLGDYTFESSIIVGRSQSLVSVAERSDNKKVVIKSDTKDSLMPEIVFNCYANSLTKSCGMFPKVLDFGIIGNPNARFGAEGYAFMVTELVGGVMLEDYLKQLPLPPFEDTLAIVFQIGFALRELWVNYGIRHCDLHARNIMVDTNNRYTKQTGRMVLSGTRHSHDFDLKGRPRVWILDLGFAESKRVPHLDRPLTKYLIWMYQRYARLWQLYLRPNSIPAKRFRIESGFEMSPEVVEFIQTHTECKNNQSDIAALLGIEDILIKMYNLDTEVPAQERIPPSRNGRPLTYYQILTSERFEKLKAKAKKSKRK